jgi:hypothetical protein
VRRKANGVYSLRSGKEKAEIGLKFFGVKMLPLGRRDTGLILSHALSQPR